MMTDCKVLSNLYYHVVPYDDFESHMRTIYISKFAINRELYHITDLTRWFESDFNEGEELITKIISEKGKYKF